MENENDNSSHREYAPYESAVAFLKKRLAGKDRVRWSFVIQGIPDEAAARTMSLQVNKRFALNLEIKLLSVEGPSGSSWRLALGSGGSLRCSSGVFGLSVGGLAGTIGNLLVSFVLSQFVLLSSGAGPDLLQNKL